MSNLHGNCGALSYFQREKRAKELAARIKMEADILQYRADSTYAVDWAKIAFSADAMRTLAADLILTITGADLPSDPNDSPRLQ